MIAGGGEEPELELEPMIGELERHVERLFQQLSQVL